MGGRKGALHSQDLIWEKGKSQGTMTFLCRGRALPGCQTYSSHCLESGHVAVPDRKDAWGLRSSTGVDWKSGQQQRPFYFLSLSIVPPAGCSYPGMTQGISGHLVLALTLFQHILLVEMSVSLLQRGGGSVALATGWKLSLQPGLHFAIELYFIFASLLD